MATTPNSQIYAQTPNNGVSGVLLTTALTNTKAFDGTEAAGTAMALVYTAGANGGRCDSLIARLTSTAGATASGTTAALLVRFWMNNGSVNTTAANNKLLPFEIAIPATTVTALATAALPWYEYAMKIPAMVAGYRIYAGITVAVGGTNCAVQVLADGGDF